MFVFPQKGQGNKLSWIGFFLESFIKPPTAYTQIVLGMGSAGYGKGDVSHPHTVIITLSLVGVNCLSIIVKQPRNKKPYTRIDIRHKNPAKTFWGEIRCERKGGAGHAPEKRQPVVSILCYFHNLPLPLLMGYAFSERISFRWAAMVLQDNPIASEHSFWVLPGLFSNHAIIFFLFSFLRSTLCWPVPFVISIVSPFVIF